MKRDLIFSISTIVFAAVFLLISILNPARQTTIIGPNAWPNIVTTALLILGAIELIKTLFFKTYGDKREQLLLSNQQKVRLIQLILVMAGSILLMPYIGFLIASGVLFFVLALLFGFKNKKILPIVSLVVAFVLTIFFSRTLSVTFPRGVWIFNSLSNLIY